MFSRRSFVRTSSLAAIAATLPSRLLSAASTRRFSNLTDHLAQLEKDCSGRLGVAILDTGSNELGGHRIDERFAMCSTFKMLLAAAVLQRADRHEENLNRAISIPATALVPNSPITQQYAGRSMSVSELCAAAITVSDNTAANLLLATIDGPSGITRFARSLGDRITRLDRIETSLNEAAPGDPRDTTSPAAMVSNWNTLLLGDALSQSSRKQLTEWLIANKTGGERLRGALPPAWTVADKTGSNGTTTTNDVVIVWPPNQAPVIVAAYLTACTGTEAKRNGVLAEVGRRVAKSIQTA